MAHKSLSLMGKIDMGIATGVTKFSRHIPVSQIQTRELFRMLMPFEQSKVDAIAEDIREHGFDESQPVHLWKEENVLIDGYQRLAASKQVGLYDIPVYDHSFVSETEAYEYALKLQINRRNLNDAGLLTAIQKLDTLKKNGRPSTETEDTEKGKSSETTGEKLGISARKVERTRAVLNSGDDGTIDAVKTGRMSINAAYNAVRQKREQSARKISDVEPDNDIDTGFENKNVTPVRESHSMEQDTAVDKNKTPFEKLLLMSGKELAAYIQHLQERIYGAVGESEETLTVEEWQQILQAQRGEEEK